MSPGNTTCGDSCVYLPEELIVYILKRLPIKSLLLCMSVCKTWYSLIKNPNFISTHLSHQITIAKNSSSNNQSEPGYLLYVDDAGLSKRCFVHCDNESFDLTQELVFPEIPPDCFEVQAGICNGIVCFSPTQRATAVLWNPSLRKLLHLDIPHTVRPTDCSLEKTWPGKSIVYATGGIGFDLLSNDYKFVSITQSMNRRERSLLSVCVYSLKEGAWKHVYSDFVRTGHCIVSHGVDLNGVIHWLVAGIPSVISILTFNLADETFSEIPLPGGIDYTPTFSGFEELMIVPAGSGTGETIAFLYFNGSQKTVSLWVMEIYSVKESWRLAVSFSTGELDCNKFTNIQNVRKNGEILVGLEGERLGSLNPRDVSLKVVSDTRMEYLGPYMETLVLL